MAVIRIGNEVYDMANKADRAKAARAFFEGKTKKEEVITEKRANSAQVKTVEAELPVSTWGGDNIFGMG